eukprot:Skav214950  [mRNA]  locus=scaffold2320:68895:69170:- [translate_table: standard]
MKLSNQMHSKDRSTAVKVLMPIVWAFSVVTKIKQSCSFHHEKLESLGDLHCEEWRLQNHHDMSKPINESGAKYECLGPIDHPGMLAILPHL